MKGSKSSPYKPLSIKYPWVSIDKTQAEGHYSLTVALSREIRIEVSLTEKEIQDLDSQLVMMKELKILKGEAKQK